MQIHCFQTFSGQDFACFPRHDSLHAPGKSARFIHFAGERSQLRRFFPPDAGFWIAQGEYIHDSNEKEILL